MATGGSDYQIPGSGSFAQPVGLDPEKLSHYQILGICQGATNDEISKAYRKKARHYHPDKTGNDMSEEWMKKLNEAKSTLLSEKREDYDEKLADEGQVVVDPAGFLPGGPRPSLQFLQFFNSSKISFEGGFVQNLENFHIVLENEFKDKTNDLPALPFTAKRRVAKMPPKICLPSSSQSPLTQVLDEMNSILNEPQLNSLLEIQHKELLKILELAKTSGTKSSLPAINNRVPIMSFSNLPDKKLVSFVSLFILSDDHVIPPRSAILSSLQSIVPYTTTQTPNADRDSESSLQMKCGACEKKYGFFLTAKLSCYNCKKSFCKKCPPKHVLIPKLQPDTAQPMCSQCIKQFIQSDTDEWTKSCLQFIEAGTVKSTKAAMGCLMVALCLSDSSIKPIIKVARGLFHSGLPELAMPFVATVLHHSQDTMETLGAFFLSAQIFNSLAAENNSDPEVQWSLLLAAKDSINLVLEQASCFESGTVEIPHYTTLKKDVCDSLCILKEKQKHIQECEVKLLCLEMETLWQKRECEELLALVLDEDSTVSDSFLPAEESMTTMALEQFVAPKCAFLDRMFDEDRCAIVFFRGLLKILKKRVSEGLLDIEEAAFFGHHQEWLRDAVSDVVMSILTEDPSLLFPSDSFKEALNVKQLLKTDTFTDRFRLLFPQKHEITPPHSRNWPHLSVTGLNIKGHTKFEKAVYSQVQEGNWDEKDAAMAYVDYVGACDHPAEIALCFLNAAMWLLKHLQASITTSSLAEKYATKKLIVRCIHMSLTMAYLRLHPGMQLHVSRLCLGIMMQTMQLIEGFATKEDGHLISSLLELMIYCCRFCPIWHFPSVPLSEAVLLNIKTRRFHEDFLLALQKVDVDKLPMKQSELLYQLYENNLRYTCPLEDPAAACARAMETLLCEKGWTWNDVADRMTSPLSPRDDDGWLIQQPSLGVPMEFSELKGFSFNLDSDHPSIEIIAIKADTSRGRVGLFSMQDVQTVLQLDPSDLYPIFFSLDSPDEHHRFHPFQQFRYGTEKLQKTPLLHTLFETDYLLKSFSVGSEVSANPPFNQRPCKAGLLKNLPPNLQEAVKPVSERGNTLSNINRFWIQAEELIFEPNQTGSKITFRVSDLKMKICSHPLLPGPDGKLQDTEDETDPDSPEAKFASDLTSHYNELGLHFPMFARLRELAKLQLLGLILRNTLDDMKCKAEGKEVEVPRELLTEIQQEQRQRNQTRVSEILTTLDQEIGIWPAADNYSKVSSLTQEMMDLLPYHIRIQASYSDVKPHAVDVLRKKDDSALSQVTNLFMQLFEHRISRSSLQAAVRRWLSSRNSSATTDLKNLICRYMPLTTHDDLKRQIIDFHREKYTAFKRKVDNITAAPPKPDKNPCNWVPAALLEEQNMDSVRLCYGGVLIAPNIKIGSVPNLPSMHSRTEPVRRAGTSFQNPSSRSPFRAPSTLSAPADDTRSGGNSFGVSIHNRVSTAQYAPKPSEHKPVLNTFRRGFILTNNKGDQHAAAAAAGGGGKSGGGGGGGRRGGGGRGRGDGSGDGGSRNRGNKKAAYAVGAAALVATKSAQNNGSNPDEHMKERRAQSNKEPPYWLEPTRNHIVAPNGEAINTTSAHNGKALNIVYGIYSANTGGLLYVGMTKGEFGKRIQAHVRDVRNGKKSTNLVKYFNTEGRSVDELRAVVLEKVPPGENLRRREMDHVVKYETKTRGLNMRYPMNMRKYETLTQ